jgi:hypothetical protein
VKGGAATDLSFWTHVNYRLGSFVWRVVKQGGMQGGEERGAVVVGGSEQKLRLCSMLLLSIYCSMVAVVVGAVRLLDVGVTGRNGLLVDRMYYYYLSTLPIRVY